MCAHSAFSPRTRPSKADRPNRPEYDQRNRLAEDCYPRPGTHPEQPRDQSTLDLSTRERSSPIRVPFVRPGDTEPGDRRWPSTTLDPAFPGVC